MKIAIIGSRTLFVSVADLEQHIPSDVTEIVSGGAKGIDTSARNYAFSHGLKLTEFLPEYSKYKKCAPLKRSLHIIEYADSVIAFWDGKSNGTKFVIDKCRELNKPIKVYILNSSEQN